jgi:hemoglobin
VSAGESGPTPFAALGGEPGVRALVDRFYELMDTLPEVQELRRLHPNLERAADSLFKYLSGWFGGPPLYVQERGHPRLRMRHLPFAIGARERDQWLRCMRQALAEQVEDEALRGAVEQAFTGLAEHMVNRA